MIDLGREICTDLESAVQREWLVANGIGGYAMGTVGGALTRRYHGLLVAALDPPLGRTLLLSRLDETMEYQRRSYPLFTNQWASGAVEPAGYRHIDSFRLVGTTPVWTFSMGDALLEKWVWMQPGENTTYIRYRLLRARAGVRCTIKAIVNYRDHHGTIREGGLQVDVSEGQSGLRATAFEGAVPLYLLSRTAGWQPAGGWIRDYHYRVEAFRGLEATEDLFHAGTFRADLAPGDSLTIVASTEPAPALEGESAYQQRSAHEANIQSRWAQVGASQARRDDLPGAALQLALAADQFIVRRPSAADPEGRTIIAGYPWFADWGRDTMIALPGLTLATGRSELARSVLRTFAGFVDRGMLPNRFPEAGEQPEYNTVDATLWYFEAVRAYLAHSQGNGAASVDRELIGELYPVLQDIIHWHQQGTRYDIHLDKDGLLYSGEPGVQLTWMDARVGDWVVTPRQGKAIEVNALWYNALRSMSQFADLLGESSEPWTKLAERVAHGFQRFWNGQAGYCFDVIDGPQGADPSLRPNQLFAISLYFPVLAREHRRAVVEACSRHLYTPHGLRSLAPEDPQYVGRYEGDAASRDGSYHQGTVWGWLIGPFASAHLRVYRDPGRTWTYVRPLMRQLYAHCVGSISEIFDGDPPFQPRGCIAQAWSVAELLRVWQQIQEAG